MTGQPSRSARVWLGDDASKAWFTVFAGYAVMYLPAYWAAANSIWQTDEMGHGPIILAVLVWMFWTLRRAIIEAPTRALPVLGWSVFGIGWLAYVVGRPFDIWILTLGSQVFVVAGVLLLMKGMPSLRIAWFPTLYIVFMIPVPGIVTDTVTGPLKQWISGIVVEALHLADYPVGRTGVTISIGQYQLLVADACSGLNSMFSLSALGLLFMYLTARKSKLHNAIMLASILPMAFAANIVRVIALVLVTYHLGDEAGQGFLHGAAGIVLILAALALLISLDALLVHMIRPSRAGPSPGIEPSSLT